MLPVSWNGGGQSAVSYGSLLFTWGSNVNNDLQAFNFTDMRYPAAASRVAAHASRTVSRQSLHEADALSSLPSLPPSFPRFRCSWYLFTGVLPWSYDAHM